MAVRRIRLQHVLVGKWDQKCLQQQHTSSMLALTFQIKQCKQTRSSKCLYIFPNSPHILTARIRLPQAYQTVVLIIKGKHSETVQNNSRKGTMKL